MKIHLPKCVKGASPVSPLAALLRMPDEAVSFEHRVRIANGNAPSIKSAKERKAGKPAATPAQRRDALKLRESGMLYKDIGEVVGLSVNAVHHICK